MLNFSEYSFISENLSFSGSLNNNEKDIIKNYTYLLNLKKGSVLNDQNRQCLGLILIKEGQLRIFITSPDGKEITLFRLLPLDICILSAACMIRNITFDVNIEVERDSEIYVIPTDRFNEISESNIFVKNFTLELVSARFSEVMWIFEQFVFGSAAKRLANYLLEKSNIDQTSILSTTHESIANNIGTAREVVSRLLKHFERDNIIKLSRSTIEITDNKKLLELSD